MGFEAIFLFPAIFPISWDLYFILSYLGHTNSSVRSSCRACKPFLPTWRASKYHASCGPHTADRQREKERAKERERARERERERERDRERESERKIERYREREKKSERERERER